MSPATAVPAPDRIGAGVWRVAGVLVVGAFLTMLDGSIVAVGLDTMARALGVGLAAASWIATAYLLALAVSLPASGWLGRRVGAGRLWVAALAAFTVASGLCALAGSLPVLVALRVVQGLAAGLLVPAGQTVIGQMVGPVRLGRVMGVLGIAVSVGPAVGPALGGVVLATLSWPWLFGIVVPIGALGVVAGWRVVPRGRIGDAGPLDLPGLVLVAVGLSATLLAVTTWGERGTGATAAVLVPLAVGIGALGGFVAWARRAAHPLTDLSLLRRPVYAAACASATATAVAMFGGLLLLPLWFQLREGTGPVATGLSLISFGVGTALAGPFAGRLTDRFGGGAVSALAGLAVVGTTVPFVALDAASPVLVQALLLVRGLAIGFAAVPPTVAAYAAVTPAQLPDAATQVNVVQRVGGAAGGAVVAVLLAVGLPSGRDAAFAAAFTWLAAASAVAAACSTWLWAAQRRSRS